MTNVLSAFSLAAAQLIDPPILRVLVKSICVTLGIFVLLGALLWYGLQSALIAQGWSSGTELSVLLAAILTVLGGWLLFRIIALAVIQFFADEVVQAVERRHYPEALGNARTLGLTEELTGSVKSAGRTVLVNLLALLVAIPLLLTAIGPAIIFGLANSWLIGRELQDMIWLRHRRSPQEAAPLSKLERLVVGGIVTLLLAIPFINLLAPVLGAASAAHLVHAKLPRKHYHG